MSTVDSEKHDDKISTPSMLKTDWMSNLPPHLHDVPLCKIAIPGSHNSGAYALHKDWELSPDASAALTGLSSIPFLGAMAKDIIHKWSICQNLSILDQLKAGIRFLDIRVAHREADDEFYVIHSLFGPKVYDCMEDVKKFLIDHPKEVVLLDFNHFFNMQLEQHILLLTSLLSIFESFLCPFTTMDKTTLNMLWRNNFRVLIFYHHDVVAEFTDLWPKKSIFSKWANTTDVDKCLSCLREAAKNRHEEQFHVCQAVLTPDWGFIMQRPLMGLHIECARKISPLLASWLNTLQGHEKNIYSIDFAQEDNFIESVISLNR